MRKIYKIPNGLRNQLIKLFTSKNYLLEASEDGERLYVNRTKCNFCPEEAFDDQEFCFSGRCPIKHLCDDLLGFMGECIDWYGDYAAFDEADKNEAAYRLEALLNFVYNTVEVSSMKNADQHGDGGIGSKQGKKWRASEHDGSWGVPIFEDSEVDEGGGESESGEPENEEKEEDWSETS